MLEGVEDHWGYVKMCKCHPVQMDLDTGRRTCDDSKIRYQPHDVSRAMHLVKVKGGCVVYQGSLRVWSTTLDWS